MPPKRLSSKNDISTVEAVTRRLEKYILSERYAGYDPYDVLSSPLFRLPVLKSSHTLRFLAQQLARRSPLNIRPLIGVNKAVNPVTLGLCVQSFANLIRVFPDMRSHYTGQARYCIDQLKRMQSTGYSGICWGYNFDWQSRYARLDAFVPTIVATGIITNGLFVYYEATGDDDALDMCRSAIQFVVKDLKRTYEGSDFCFSYSPLDSQVVLNATMKAARLLAQIYSVDRDPDFLNEAASTVNFVQHHQQPDGSWSYSLGDKREWIDNFHTGYILDCLHEYRKWSKDSTVDTALDRGFQFYKANFFDELGRPKYYTGSLFPIDSTAAAQSILTLSRFGEPELALRVALWSMAHMQAGDGHFFYQYRPMIVNRISYMRWSNAWMFAALSYLLKSGNTG